MLIFNKNHVLNYKKKHYFCYKLKAMKKDHKLDKLDRKILKILSKDARTPFLEVARECGVSGAAIHQRVNKLIQDKVITGSQFLLDPHKIGYSTCCYIGIFLTSASLVDEIVSEFIKIPEIVECHYTTGNYSLFIKVYSRDNMHLKEILSDKIQVINGVERTETYISLEAPIAKNLPVE